MISILTDLYDHFKEKECEAQVKGILKIFTKPYPDQFVYLNYLIKYIKSDSFEKIYFLDVIKEMIEMLKECLFIERLNSKNKILIKSLERLLKNYSKIGKPICVESCRSKMFNKLLEMIVCAKENFKSVFTIDYLSENIYNILKSVDKIGIFGYEMINFLLDNYEFSSDFFEYENKMDFVIIKRVNIQGMRCLISLILNGHSITTESNKIIT